MQGQAALSLCALGVCGLMLAGCFMVWAGDHTLQKDLTVIW